MAKSRSSCGRIGPALERRLGGCRTADHVKTIALDNEREFGTHELFANRLDAVMYFANAHASWQHGANEKVNGLGHQYFPKNRPILGVRKPDCCLNSPHVIVCAPTH